MLDSVFRNILDLAGGGDQAAQARLNDLAREGTLAAHVARVADADDAEWESLLAEVVEQSGGPLSERSLVDAMVDMSRPADSASASTGTVDLAAVAGPDDGATAMARAWLNNFAPVDLAAASPGAVDLAVSPSSSRPIPPGMPAGLRERLDERERIENTGAWAARSDAQIAAGIDLAWSRYRQAERDGEPLTEAEYAAKHYGAD